MFARPAHGSTDDDLSLEFPPVDDERSPRIGFQVPGLTGSVVGEKAETTLVKTLEEDDAGGGLAVGVGSGQGHRVGFDDFGVHCLVQPFVKLEEGVEVGILFGQTASGVILAEFGQHGSMLAHSVFYIPART